MKVNKQKSWGNLLGTRSVLRKHYPTGPKAGKGIWRKYLEFFKKTLKEIKPKIVLVLGSTPELRDLVLEHNLNVITVDFSKEAIKKTSSIMKYKNNPKEKILFCNWLDINLPNGSLDFIIGDGITNNIGFRYHRKLFKKLSRLLKDHGRIFLRDVTTDNKRKSYLPEEIIKKAHKNKWHPYDLWFEMYVYNSISFNRKEFFTDTMILRKYLENNIYPKNILTAKEKFYLKNFINSDVKSIFIPEDDWLKNFKKYFKLLTIDKANDYRYCQHFKFYYGEKKW